MAGHFSCLPLLLIAVSYVNGFVPPQCPNLGSGTCYSQENVAMLQPSSSLTTPNYVIGGLFNIRTPGLDAITCGSGFSPNGLLHAHAFLFSVNYWKKQLFPNSQVDIGAVVFDSCGRTEQMIQNLLGFEQCTVRIPNVDRHNLVGFVGPDDDVDAAAAASLMQTLDLTVISPLAKAQELGDKDEYRYFLRTVPSISEDIGILTKVLQQIKTKYVAVLYEEGHIASFSEFERQVKTFNICITDSYSMTGQETDAELDIFVNNELPSLKVVRYIVLFASQTFIENFIRRFDNNQNLRAMHFVFLMTSEVSSNSEIFTKYVAVEDAILLKHTGPSLAAVETAYTEFLKYWNQTSASFSNYSFIAAFNGALKSIPPDNSVKNTIMATESIIRGVNVAGSVICNLGNNINGDYLCSNFFNAASRGSNIFNYIRNATGHFESSSNNMNMQLINYDILRYKYRFYKAGSYSNGNYMELENLPILGYTGGQCQDTPCLKCNELPVTTTTPAPTTTISPTAVVQDSGNFSLVAYPANQHITGAYMTVFRKESEYATRFEVGQRWIIALGVLAGLGILAVIIFEIYILYKLLGTQMGHKWRTMWLGQLLLFGIFLCYLTLFAYLPIPTKATCGITRFGVGVSYSICFAVLLVKLMVILTSKSSDNSLIPGDMESPNYLKGIYQFLMFVFVVGVQVVIDTQWLITVPPEAVKVKSNSGQYVWICNHYTFEASSAVNSMRDMSSFVRNEFENHILSLVYIMFLILITTLLALNSHGIITNHRESIFIGIAAGFSIPVWIAWTLIAGLNRTHAYAHEFGDGCIAFGLFLTATLILFSMFLPKVRQLVNMGVEGIYFEDDRETYYAGSVIMAPPSYKSHPNSVIYVNNQGIYTEPIVLGNGDSTSNYLRHPGYAGSVYSAPPATYVKRGADSTRGGSVLRVTDDLSGKRPPEKKRPMSEVAYGTGGRPRSTHGTLPRSRSQTNLGAL